MASLAKRHFFLLCWRMESESNLVELWVIVTVTQGSCWSGERRSKRLLKDTSAERDACCSTGFATLWVKDGLLHRLVVLWRLEGISSKLARTPLWNWGGTELKFGGESSRSLWPHETLSSYCNLPRMSERHGCKLHLHVVSSLASSDGLPINN